jgi:hypothetical protein|tara:strand:+ start:926 stop:1348 length:423 start_codon:yes stop_codon:yes gene_type:complete
MVHTTTVTVIAIVDMQDPLEGFVRNKRPPGARLSLAGQSTEHQYSEDQEMHRFTITADLDEGEHKLSFEFTSKDEGQGALLIKELYVQGAPIGLPIYDGTYHSWTTGDNLLGHLYMGWPGEWRYSIQAPVEQHSGDIGFE